MRRAVVVLAIAASVLCGCTTLTAGRGSSGLPPLAADAQLPVVNGSDSAVDRTIENGISDVESFWRKNFPLVSGGKAFPELTGKLYSVNGLQTTPATSQNACLAKDPQGAVDNAFYCELDDSVAWDRNDNHLIAQLGKKYGTFLMAVVFAHEFGHAIQHRLGVFDTDLPTIDIESQADCAAGAFIKSVEDLQAPHFRVSAEQLDQTLLGYLQVRDPPPVSSSEISHGNGFDRLGAISDGIQNGVTYCYAKNYFDRKFTERPFTTDADYQQGGNEPFAQVIDGSSTGGGLQPDLNRFWKAASASINKSWSDVKIAEAPHPRCGDTAAKFGYCPDDNTVYFDKTYAQQAYNSLPDLTVNKQTGDVTVVDDAPADYALGTLFVYGWGFAVRHQLADLSLDDADALLAATCYAGAYSADINVAQAQGDARFLLSPPDMDEATAAILQLVPQDDAYGSRDTTGLQRIQKFRTGYFGGLSVC